MSVEAKQSKGAHMPEDGSFSVTLDRLKDYQFRATFQGTEVDPITLDEPPPRGSYGGPSASRLLAAAVGHCLTASLLFRLEKARIELDNVQTKVVGTFRRNEKRRLRMGSLDVELSLSLPIAESGRMDRCLEIFEAIAW